MNGKRRKKRFEKALEDIKVSSFRYVGCILTFIFILFLIKTHYKLETFIDYLSYAMALNLACDLFLTKSNEQKKEE